MVEGLCVFCIEKLALIGVAVIYVDIFSFLIPERSKRFTVFFEGRELEPKNVIPILFLHYFFSFFHNFSFSNSFCKISYQCFQVSMYTGTKIFSLFCLEENLGPEILAKKFYCNIFVFFVFIFQ